MARVVHDDEPRNTVVVERDSKSNVGLVLAVIIIILLLLWFFWGNLFGGGTDVNVQTPAPTGGTRQ